MDELQSGWDFSFQPIGTEIVKDTDGTQRKEEINADKTFKCTHTGTANHITRRIKSELVLEESLPWHFRQGDIFHCMSNGDVDSLSYLRAIVKQQPVKYMLLSTWVMAMTDVEEIASWIARGYVGRCDFYVGEHVPSGYAAIYQAIKQKCLVPGARIAVFRNHSKVFAGYGRDFDFAGVSSANVNTNPRCENMTITIDTGVVDFYKQWFDEIKSFLRDCDNWEPWHDV